LRLQAQYRKLGSYLMETFSLLGHTCIRNYLVDRSFPSFLYYSFEVGGFRFIWS